MAIMAMTQPRTSALTIMLQVSNLDNRETGSLLVLPHSSDLHICQLQCFLCGEVGEKNK